MEAGALDVRFVAPPKENHWVPSWLVLYAFLGLGDMAFTLAAFEFGAREANPFLGALQTTGLFEFAKLSLTLLIICIGFRYKDNRAVFICVTAANVVMVALNVYHVSLLTLFA